MNEFSRSLAHNNENQHYIYRLNSSKSTLEVLPGYPQPTGAGNRWNGLNAYGNVINAIFQQNLGNKIFFFLRTCQYIQFDIRSQSIDYGYPRNINLGFPGLSLCDQEISTATINIEETKYLIFLKNGQFIQFDILRERIDPGYPKSIDYRFPGLRSYATKIVSCFIFNRASYAFVLDDGRYLLYHADGKIVSEPRILDFPGLAPYSTDIMAFLNVNDTDFYVFMKPMPYN